MSLNNSRDRHRWGDEARNRKPLIPRYPEHHDAMTDQYYQIVLPNFHEEGIPSAIPAMEVTKVALRLRHLIEECVPCELEEEQITVPHSKIITKGVIKAAKEAGSGDFDACVVYALLVNKRWFKKQAMLELWDADLHNLRAVACEVIAKEM